MDFGKLGENSGRDCPFCKAIRSSKIPLENDYAYAILDSHPVTEGHTLVIPKRHIADYFEISEDERRAIDELLRIRRKQLLEEDSSISGFNIGVNCGESAGQTIFHVHVHLIPRRSGDISRPKGGVRGVIPDKKDY
jgi:ATP adenylyltransferase